MYCSLCGVLLTDAEIDKSEKELKDNLYLCFDCLDETEEERGGEYAENS